jgi:type IV secretion system protein VirB10
MSELQQEQPDVVPGERGASRVSDPTAVNPLALRKIAGLFVMLVVLGAVAVYFWKFKQEADEKKATVSQVESQLPTRTFGELPTRPRGLGAMEPSAPLLPPSLPAPGAPAPGASDLELLEEEAPKKPAPSSSGQGSRPRPPLLDKGQSPLMAGSGGTANQAPKVQSVDEYVASLLGKAPSAPGGVAPSPVAAAPVSSSGRLSASFIGDRNFLLAKGSFIDCVLQTRLDSTIPGMTSCVVSRNVFSDNGKILLIERGSTVSGEYQADIQQGQARLFVLWTRIKTPNGVVVQLESPGTDALGGAGVPGRVNTHFFARFGSALLLSLVDDVAGAAVGALSKGEGQVLNFGNTAGAAQGAAQEVIKSTISIKPTLTKNQGEVVGIYVANDLDFSEVYRATSY